MYRIVFSEDAKKDLKELNRKAPKQSQSCQNFWMKFANTREPEPVR